MKYLIKKIPFVNLVASFLYQKYISFKKPFTGSKQYWVDRYNSGGNSGDGSFNELAIFKAEILNDFVLNNNIESVLEYGCGDGNQLKLAKYPLYTGFDVSSKALSLCKNEFISDSTKAFKLMEDASNETAELTLSLDVIYHLIEDCVFVEYMNKIFDSSTKFVIIYSSDTDINAFGTASHVKQRNFSKWVKAMKLDWRLIKHIPNRFPFNGNTITGSDADFFIYQRFMG